jgi:tyrosine-protein kinase Etk/Wzc
LVSGDCQFWIRHCGNQRAAVEEAELVNELDPTQTHAADDSLDRVPPSSNDEEDGVGILDLVLVLAARKGLIFSLVILGGILATVVAFFTPPTYTATAVIMPPQQQSSSAAALLGQLGGVASLAGQSLGIKNPADIYVGILNSRTVADKLISEFKLRDVYKKKNLTDTRKKLSSRTSFNSAKYSLIQVSVEDRDPKRAADIANAYVASLQEQTSRLAVTEASQRRLFFERELESEKNHLSDAESALKRTQEQKGIYQVNSQVEAVIRSMAQVRAEIAAREVNLQRLRTGATTENPEVLRQEIELTTLRGQLKELEASSAKKSAGDPFMPTTTVPAAGLDYARRLRDVKYHEALFELLAKQYEVARIDEAKESPVIQIVDRAIPPDRKSSPMRNIYLIVGGGFLGAVIGIIWTFLRYSLGDPIHAAKLASFNEALRARHSKMT